jgi:sec-independent protein translocase protein TatC
MADNPDEPSRPDDTSDADAADADTGSDESGRDASSPDAEPPTNESSEESRSDRDGSSADDSIDAASEPDESVDERTDETASRPLDESQSEGLGGGSLPGPSGDDDPGDGAHDDGFDDDFVVLDEEGSLDEGGATDDTETDESEPTGGLQRVDDTHDPTPDTSVDESPESIGLPGPSMDTKPMDGPSGPEGRDHVAEHQADAPYVDDPTAGDPEAPPPGADSVDMARPEADPGSPTHVPDEEERNGYAPPERLDEDRAERDAVGPPESEATAPMSDPGMTDDPGSSTFMDAPPDDQEMPLTEHIEEMVLRLSAVAVSAAGVAILFYGLGVNHFIPELWYHIHPGSVEACRGTPNTPFAQCAAPHVYSPIEYFLTKLKLSGLVGLVVALPVGIYQTYLFMRPGLYPKERRYYLASVPLSFVLAVMGVAFATFVILPLLFEYFLTYSADTVSIAFQLKDTMNLMLVLMGWLAVIFQIPLLMSLAVMMGVTSRAWMASKRIYFWGGFGAIGFFTGAADPTGVAPILLTLTMIVLFEVTLLLLRWVGR